MSPSYSPSEPYALGPDSPDLNSSAASRSRSAESGVPACSAATRASARAVTGSRSPPRPRPRMPGCRCRSRPTPASWSPAASRGRERFSTLLVVGVSITGQGSHSRPSGLVHSPARVVVGVGSIPGWSAWLGGGNTAGPCAGVNTVRIDSGMLGTWIRAAVGTPHRGARRGACPPAKPGSGRSRWRSRSTPSRAPCRAVPTSGSPCTGSTRWCRQPTDTRGAPDAWPRSVHRLAPLGGPARAGDELA